MNIQEIIDKLNEVSEEKRNLPLYVCDMESGDNHEISSVSLFDENEDHSKENILGLNFNDTSEPTDSWDSFIKRVLEHNNISIEEEMSELDMSELKEFCNNEGFGKDSKIDDLVFFRGLDKYIEWKYSEEKERLYKILINGLVNSTALEEIIDSLTEDRTIKLSNGMYVFCW